VLVAVSKDLTAVKPCFSKILQFLTADAILFSTVVDLYSSCKMVMSFSLVIKTFLET